MEKTQHFCGTHFARGINVLVGQGQEMGTLLLTPIADCELIKINGAFHHKARLDP